MFVKHRFGFMDKLVDLRSIHAVNFRRCEFLRSHQGVAVTNADQSLSPELLVAETLNS